MNLNENQELPTWKFWKKRRYIVTAFSFLGLLIAYVLRVNLSIAVVKMTSNRTLIDENGQTYGREFEWDSKLQGLVHSSFYYGYITTSLPGGWIAARIGGARIFGLGIAVTSLLSIITPFVAKWNVYALITVRAIEGIFEGAAYIAMNGILSYWAPLLERSKMTTIIYTGGSTGIVLGMLICSILAERFDWPSIFYIPGIVGILWYICWCIVVKDRPADDPHISQSELHYINSSLDTVDNKRISHPWKAILTSVPVWAIFIANTTENWGFYTMVTYLPKFMSDALGFPLEKAGIYASLPYILASALILSAGQLADYLRSKKILTTTQVRKSFTCTAFVCQSIFMACTAFIMTPIVAVICIIFSIGFEGLTRAGFAVNYLDIGGKHTSVVIGLSGYLTFLPGIISPILTGYILQNETVDEWRTVFLISSGIYLFGALIYGVFASAEEQPWTKSGTKDFTGCENPSFKETVPKSQ